MRTHRTVATLSLALLVGACDKRQEPTAGLPNDLQRDLAAAAATGTDLASVPRSYQRARFVSDVERWKSSVPVKRTVTLHHHAAQPAVSEQPATESTADVAPEPVVTASASPAPVATETAPVLDAAVGDAPPPYHGPSSAPSGSTSEGPIVERGNGGGGLGGMLGGIIGAVVIRGGHGGIDKCDPRTDGRRPTLTGRPDFRDPMPLTPPMFPGRRGL